MGSLNRTSLNRPSFAEEVYEVLTVAQQLEVNKFPIRSKTREEELKGSKNLKCRISDLLMALLLRAIFALLFIRDISALLTPTSFTSSGKPHYTVPPGTRIARSSNTIDVFAANGTLLYTFDAAAPPASSPIRRQDHAIHSAQAFFACGNASTQISSLNTSIESFVLVSYGARNRGAAAAHCGAYLICRPSVVFGQDAAPSATLAVQARIHRLFLRKAGFNCRRTANPLTLSLDVAKEFELTLAFVAEKKQAISLSVESIQARSLTGTTNPTRRYPGSAAPSRSLPWAGPGLGSPLTDSETKQDEATVAVRRSKHASLVVERTKKNETWTVLFTAVWLSSDSGRNFRCCGVEWKVEA
uniref:Uncharacterized protein n=1 Tax=Mycena chlorophos TaxID=658473 RepID=A0ABQ0M4S5_MYCCL|nr:predicted protein [Mycena chlorophos]